MCAATPIIIYKVLQSEYTLHLFAVGYANSVTDVTDDFPRGEDILTSSQCSIKTTEHLTCRTDNIIMQN